MPRNRAVIALILAAASMTATADAAKPTPTLYPKGEAELAKMLVGRVAEKPVDCIDLGQSSTIIDKTAIVYGSGNVIYVNRPGNAESLQSDDVLVTKTWMSQLCRLDIVQLHDRAGMFWRGSVGLEQFVPYRRVKQPAAAQPQAQATEAAAPAAMPPVKP